MEEHPHTHRSQTQIQPSAYTEIRMQSHSQPQPMSQLPPPFLLHIKILLPSPQGTAKIIVQTEGTGETHYTRLLSNISAQFGISGWTTLFHRSSSGSETSFSNVCENKVVYIALCSLAYPVFLQGHKTDAYIPKWDTVVTTWLGLQSVKPRTGTDTSPIQKNKQKCININMAFTQIP